MCETDRVLKWFGKIVDIVLNKRALDNQTETVKDYRDGYQDAVNHIREDIRSLIETLT